MLQVETIKFNKDIKLMCITAESFPDDILATHERLHKMVPFSERRNYFGISWPENGTIVYRACAEEINPGEAEKFECQILTLKKGEYACLTINGFRKSVQSIGRAFEKLLVQPNIDPEGYCVEWYYTDQDSVKCMVRLV